MSRSSSLRFASLLRHAQATSRPLATVSATRPSSQFLRCFSTETPSTKRRKAGSRVVVVTSGKGGVGKTTSTASLGLGLAERGFRVCLIDFDIGLRNLDLHLGMERRVVYDFIHVIQGECHLRQALIKDKRNPNLSLLAASQTKDKSVLTEDGVELVLNDLRRQFDFILCDSPAGIESGAHHAMYFADEAVVCTNPEMSSVRDADKMIGLIASKSQRAVDGREPVDQKLLITRINPQRVDDQDMLSVDDISDMLGLPVIGLIPESHDVLKCSNLGKPVLSADDTQAGQAFQDTVDRFLGQQIPLKLPVVEQEPGLLASVGKKISGIFG